MAGKIEAVFGIAGYPACGGCIISLTRFAVLLFKIHCASSAGV